MNPSATGYDLQCLSGCQCRWPVNEAEVGTLHLFCGAPTRPGYSYCDEHYRKGYQVKIKLAPLSEPKHPRHDRVAAE